MSVITNVYSVNQIKQLIDLNQNKTNFEVTFEVKSLDGTPFKAVVLSEGDLNSGNAIAYKDVENGYISGHIVNDKGVYQNYFLLLKADNPVECEVTLNIKDIPINPEVEIQKQQYYLEQNRLKSSECKPKTDWVLIIGIIVIVSVGLWFMFGSSKPKNKLLTESITKAELPVSTPLEITSSNTTNETNLNIPPLDGLSVDIPSIENVLESSPPIFENFIPSKRHDGLVDKLKTYFGKE